MFSWLNLSPRRGSFLGEGEMKNFVLFFLFALLLSNCEKRYDNNEVVWNSKSGEVAPDVVTRNDFSSDKLVLKSKQETVERSSQMLGKAIIENTFLQVVKNNKGKLLYVKSNFSNHPKDFSVKEIDDIYEKRDVILKKLKTKHKEIVKASHIYPVQIIYSNDKDKPSLFLQVDWVNHDEDKVLRTQFASNAKVINEQEIQSEFQGEGVAYPNGPRWSNLERVKLYDLDSDGTLTSPKIKITTKSQEVAQAKNHVFEYKEDDPRFDQVQVFLFAQNMMDLFKQKLGLELPYNIEIETHIGTPQKKTVMFYCNKKVNLGQGDEVNYKNILKDPTIVMHEVAHAYVDMIAALPQGALNEAFADFFTSSFLNHPRLGEVSYLGGPYTRSMEEKTKFTEKTGKVYADSIIVSGTLWDLRNEIGASKIDALSLKLLSRLGPNGELDEVGKLIEQIAAEDFLPAEQQKVNSILKNRMWEL